MSEDQMVDVMGEHAKAAKATFKRLDSEKVRGFIESQADVVGPVSIGEIRFPTEGAGSSNGIGLFDAVIDRGSGPRSEALVVRYSPGPTLLTQKSYEDEFKTLLAVRAAAIPSPRAFWLDPDGGQLGAQGYIMERIDGEMPTASLYSTGPFSRVDATTRNEMLLGAAGFHGRLRRSAIGADQVPHLAQRGPEADSMIARELGWWMEEARRASHGAADKLAYVEGLYHWLISNQPTDCYAPVLVHGDAQFANLMYRDGRIAAALDWELSFLGHNESDLALLYFIVESQKVFDSPAEGTPTEEEFVARFEQESGSPVCHYPYFRLFCMMKVQSIGLMNMKTMPGADMVWGMFKSFTEAAWEKARGAPIA